MIQDDIKKWFDDDMSQYADAIVVDMPKNMTTIAQLFIEYQERLEFPEYFGHNWDALLDCLRDLDWVDNHHVVIRHVEIPKLPPRDLKTYFEIMHDAQKDWLPGEDHQLHLQFPRSLEAEVRNVLR